MFFQKVMAKFDAKGPTLLHDPYRKVVSKATSATPNPIQSSDMHEVVIALRKGGSLSDKHTAAGAIIHNIRLKLVSDDMLVVLKAYTLLHYIFRNASHAVFRRLANKTLIEHRKSDPSHTSRMSRTSRASQTMMSENSCCNSSKINYALPIPHSRTNSDPLTAFIAAYAKYLSERLRLKAQADFPPVRTTDSSDEMVAAHFLRASDVQVTMAAKELVNAVDAILSIPFDAIVGEKITLTMRHLRAILDPALRLISRDVLLLWQTTCNTITRMISLYYHMQKPLADEALTVYSRFVSVVSQADGIFSLLVRVYPKWRPPILAVPLDLGPSMRQHALEITEVSQPTPLSPFHPGISDDRMCVKEKVDNLRETQIESPFQDMRLHGVLHTLTAVIHALEALFSLRLVTTPTENTDQIDTGSSITSSRQSLPSSAESSTSSTASSSDSILNSGVEFVYDSPDASTKQSHGRGAEIGRVCSESVAAMMEDVCKLWHTLEVGMIRLCEQFFSTNGEDTVRSLALYSKYVQLCKEARIFFASDKSHDLISHLYLYRDEGNSPETTLIAMRHFASEVQDIRI